MILLTNISFVPSFIKDGHVECDDENDPDTCHGFLLAVYANDLSGNKAQFFRRYQRVRPEPVTFIAPSDLEGKALLEHAHSRLIDFHLYENTDAPYSGFEAQRVLSSVEPPEFGILSTWNIAIPWYVPSDETLLFSLSAEFILLIP